MGRTRKAAVSDPLRVVGFLQCLWVKEPARVQAMFDRNGEDARESLLARLLFIGGLTGQRLRKAFGDDVCDSIVWEECTREIGGQSSAVFPPQPAHMLAVLKKHKPPVIIAFGQVAYRALMGNAERGKGFTVTRDARLKYYAERSVILCAPHPANRNANTPRYLKRVAEELVALHDPDYLKFSMHPERRVYRPFTY